MQGFDLRALMSSWALCTVAAPWMETSPSVQFGTLSFVPYSLMAATRDVLAISQATVCPCASNYGGGGRGGKLSARAPPTSPSVCLCGQASPPPSGDMEIQKGMLWVVRSGLLKT